MKRLFEIISRMSAVRRYSNRTMLKPESVLEHTACVSIIASKILGDLKQTSLYEQLNITVEDELTLYRSIVVHDMDTISVGDIPRPTKYVLKDIRELLHKIEDMSMRNILTGYGLPDEWYNYWNTAEAGKVGLILVVSDIISVVFKFWEERIILGNRMFNLVGREMKQELIRLRDDMTSMNDTFCSKFSLDTSKPGVAVYVGFMANYVCASIDILSVADNEDEFHNVGSVIGAFNEFRPQQD